MFFRLPTMVAVPVTDNPLFRDGEEGKIFPQEMPV
jgi:hypothetical protein